MEAVKKALKKKPKKPLELDVKEVELDKGDTIRVYRGSFKLIDGYKI